MSFSKRRVLWSVLLIAAGLAACGEDTAGPIIDAVLADVIASAPGDGRVDDDVGPIVESDNAVNGIGGATDVYSLDDETAGGAHSLTLCWGGLRITDGPGADFAVFENPFVYGGNPLDDQAFIEPGIVQLSQDGGTWVTYPHDYTAEHVAADDGSRTQSDTVTPSTNDPEGFTLGLFGGFVPLPIEDGSLVVTIDASGSDTGPIVCDATGGGNGPFVCDDGETELTITDAVGGEIEIDYDNADLPADGEEIDFEYAEEGGAHPADDETVYSDYQADWQGFVGVHAVLFTDADDPPADPFNFLEAGGDQFDLANLGDSAAERAIKEEGFVFLRIVNAAVLENPDTEETYPVSIFTTERGPDIDGVYGRYAVPDDGCGELP